MRYLKNAILFVLLISGFVAQTTVARPITKADLGGHIRILASDDFGGRKPGTIGENKTIDYIATQWLLADVRPLTGSSPWYQPVELTERTPLTHVASFTRTSGSRSKQIRIDRGGIILRGARQFGELENVQAIHAGYGVGKPDELRNIVDGKLVFLHLSGPKGDDDFPAYGKRKANLIEAGAWGVVTIVDGKSRFRRFARRYRSAGTSLAGEEYHANVEGLISEKQFEKLLKKVGERSLIELGKSVGFAPKPLDLIVDFSVETRVRTYTSHNVVGKISGSNSEAGAILFMGHWDHFGECRIKDEEDPDADRICNGAVDNASGISLLIETAKRLGQERHERDIYFLATTGEEMGLLGAKAFVAESHVNLERFVAVFNADTVALSPQGKSIAVVGRGKTDLDPDIEKIAKAQQREIDKTDTANAFLKRQDGFVFLEKGIPAFMITSAFSDQERLNAYLNGRYHDVSDEADSEMELGGAAADANFHVALGRYFASTETYPQKAPSE